MVGGRLVATRNDYNLKLFNGDIGVVFPDPDAGGEMRAFFSGADETLRRFVPSRLPEHETAFATTVHKSQGSEFQEVLFVLPARGSPPGSRELVYTGLLFWARRRVEITV